MKIILFGATGMIGQGALRAALADPEVSEVLTVGRSAPTATHAKLTFLEHSDFTDFSSAIPRFAGYDACLFCLGVSSAGMGEEEYTRITYGYTLAAAEAMFKANPKMVFEYISGQSTDATEKGRVMWARVKGRTENALQRVGFERVYNLRPGYIQPLDGIVAKTPGYRAAYAIGGWLFPLWKLLFGEKILTTRSLGEAMVQIAKTGAPKPVLETAEINALWRAAQPG